MRVTQLLSSVTRTPLAIVLTLDDLVLVLYLVLGNCQPASPELMGLQTLGLSSRRHPPVAVLHVDLLD